MKRHYNYTKKDLYQILPLLFIRDGEQLIVLLGFGKKNLAFVFGKNPENHVTEYKHSETVEPKENGVKLPNVKKSKLTEDQKKKILMACLVVGGVFTVLFLYKHLKKR